MFVDVIVPVSVPNTYTYGVPLEYQEAICVGQRVEVEFGKRKRYSAVVVKIHEQKPDVYQPKPILSILDDQPLITAHQIKFWQWMSSYYMANLGDVLSAALPGALKLSSESSIELLLDSEFDAADLTDQEYLVFEALSNKNTLSINDVQIILQKKQVFPVLQSLMHQRVIIVRENLKQGYKPKTKPFFRLKKKFNSEKQKQILLDQLERAPKQQEAILYYLSETKGELNWLDKKSFEKKLSVSHAIIKALADKEVIEIEAKQVDRIVDKEVGDFSGKLTDEQEVAFEEIKQNFSKNKNCLLHGVTGSGKTHVYMKLIEEQIKQEKQVLYLLPEIALTSQIIKRLQNHFGGQVGVYHSKFSDAERVEVWNKCLNGKYKILVGARSAVFLPFNELSLVIIDEEHDSSFKQYDPSPRYNGRDAAIWLAHSHQANVLLGTATPSFESFFNASQGKYGLIKLDNRFGDSVLPKIEVVNLNKQYIPGKTYQQFSKRLIDELRKTVENGKQAILFKNRRGYSSIVQCKSCAHVVKCQNCDVSLTYHKYRDDLECHYCGFRQKVPYRCPACDDNSLEKFGLGTQKIEEDLNIFLPKAKFDRMDLDTTRSKYGHQKIIDRFEKKQIDILVGTQMVTKGLHFDDVNLVGVISADSIMNYPDFRAGERALQLLMQVSGRAGRMKEQGLVLVQVRGENHKVLKYLTENDYKGFYENTIQERYEFFYPPFFRQISLTVKHKDWKSCHQAALALAQLVRARTNQKVKGPSEPLVSRIKNWYLQEIIVTLEKNPKVIKQTKVALRQSIDALKQHKGMSQVRIIVDVDPV